MEAKLPAKERKQIIYDHLNDIPNSQYEVRETSTGIYRVYRRSHPLKPITESPPTIPIVATPEPKKEETASPMPAPKALPPPKPVAASSTERAGDKVVKQKRNVITNEDIMMKLNELHNAQTNVPQRPPPEPSTPKPPVDSTVDIESKKVFESPKTQCRRNDLASSMPARNVQVPRTVTGRRKLVLA